MELTISRSNQASPDSSRPVDPVARVSKRTRLRRIQRQRRKEAETPEAVLMEQFLWISIDSHLHPEKEAAVVMVYPKRFIILRVKQRMGYARSWS